MPAPLTHGAATAWLVALVAAISPATALATPSLDPTPPPDNGTQQQQQPADPLLQQQPTAPQQQPPECQPDPAACPPADLPTGPNQPAGPAGNPATQPDTGPTGPTGQTGPTKPANGGQQQQQQQQQQQPVLAAPLKPADIQQPARHDDPPSQHPQDSKADKPDKPGSQNSYGDDHKPSHPTKPTTKPDSKPNGDDSNNDSGCNNRDRYRSNDCNNHDDNPRNDCDNRDDDHNNDCNRNDPFVIERETIRLGGCHDFTTATAKVTFERVRYGKDRFNVSVKDLNVPAGTVLTVRVDGRIAGTLTIDENGDGKLVRRGDHLPRFLRLDGEERVTISNADGDVLLSRACRQNNQNDNNDD